VFAVFGALAATGLDEAGVTELAKQVSWAGTGLPVTILSTLAGAIRGSICVGALSLPATRVFAVAFAGRGGVETFVAVFNAAAFAERGGDLFRTDAPGAVAGAGGAATFAFAFALVCAGSAFAPVPRDTADPVWSMRSFALIGFLPSSMTAAAEVGATALVFGAGAFPTEDGMVADWVGFDSTEVDDLPLGSGALAASSLPAGALAVLADATSLATSFLSLAVDVFVTSSTRAAALVGFG